MEDTAALREHPAVYCVEAPQDNTPVSAEVSSMAYEAVKNFHECFWWWNAEAPITTRADVRAVIESLRESGGHRAWWTAQAIHKCL